MLRCEVTGCKEGEGGKGKGFENKKLMLMHLGMEHRMWRCTAKQCGFESETYDELKTHRITQHNAIAAQLPTPSFITEPKNGDNIAKEKPAIQKKHTGIKAALSKSIYSEDHEDMFVVDGDRNGKGRTASEELSDTLMVNDGAKGKAATRDPGDNVMLDDGSEVRGEAYTCASPGCAFVHESEEEFRKHKELKHGFKEFIASSSKRDQRSQAKSVDTVTQIQQQDVAQSGDRRSELAPTRGGVTGVAANDLSREAPKISKSTKHNQSQTTTASEAAAMAPPRKRPAAKMAEPVDTPMPIVPENNRVKALRPMATPAPRARNMITTAVRGVSFTPKSLSAQGFAKMVIVNHDDDPKPIRRPLPVYSSQQMQNFSDDDDNDGSTRVSDSGSDDDSYGTGSENESSDSDGSDFNPPKAKRVKRAGAADHQDQSETDMSDGISDIPTPAATSRPRVTLPTSKKALREAFYNNPYSNHLSLRNGSAAGFRRDILLGGVAACPERQEAINGREPRGRIDENTDFDQGLAFPRPKKKESESMIKMNKHTQEFVRQRGIKPEEIRMVFLSSVEIPELTKPEVTHLNAGLASAVPGVAVSAGEVVKKPRHRKLGSRSKLGPPVQKRQYKWKDENRNKGRKAASATATASANGVAGASNVPVSGGTNSGKSDAAVGGKKGAARLGNGVASDANAIPVAARPARASRAPRQ